MAKYRTSLPQVTGGVFLTDSGLETDLIFHHGYDLPLFAAFVLFEEETGVEALRRYYEDHAAIAKANGAGFILESRRGGRTPTGESSWATRPIAWTPSTARPLSCCSTSARGWARARRRWL